MRLLSEWAFQLIAERFLQATTALVCIPTSSLVVRTISLVAPFLGIPTHFEVLVPFHAIGTGEGVSLNALALTVVPTFTNLTCFTLRAPQVS